MPSSRKKVILRRFAGDVIHGYLTAEAFVQDEQVNLLNLQGRSVTIPLPEVKTICFVRDFNLTDLLDPERMQRRHFQARPRGEGVWLRIVFRDTGDTLEGLAAVDAGFLDGLLVERGVVMTPPDTRSNTQKVYVPRLAIAGFEMLAVIGTAGKGGAVGSGRRTEVQSSQSVRQVPLFPEPAKLAAGELLGDEENGKVTKP